MDERGGSQMVGGKIMIKNFSDIRNHLYDESEKYWWSSLLLGF